MISIMNLTGTQAILTALRDFSGKLEKYPQFITEHHSPASILRLATQLGQGFAVSPVVNQDQEEASRSEVQLLCRAIEYAPSTLFTEEERGHLVSTLFLLRDNQHLLLTSN